MSERRPPDLRIQLFGGPALFQGNEEIPLSPFQSYLLALVYGHGPRGISRSKAAWLLWEEDDDARTRHRLSQLRYAIGKKLGGRGVIRAQGARLRKIEGGVTLDLDRFCAACQSHDIASPDVLDPHQLLDRIVQAPCPSFDTWRIGLIASHVQLKSAACAKAWDAAEHDGDWFKAKLACATLLEFRPEDPALLAALARLSLRTGEVRAAYQVAQRLTILEPGALDADQEIASLLSGYSSQPKEPLKASTPLLPLVGRDREVGTIFNHLRTARAAPLPIVVSGESGIGKTRICHEALHRLKSIGVRVLAARCGEFERSIALNPIIEAIGPTNGRTFAGRIDEPWRSVAAALFPGVSGGTPPPVSGAALPRRLFEAVRRLMDAMAEGGPMVLFVDDFQWIDQTSIAAFQYVLRRWDSGNLALLFSCRSEAILERSSDASRFLDSCVRAGSTVVDLAQLTFDDAWSLMRSNCRECSPEATAKALYQRAGGNPLFLAELCPHRRLHAAGDGTPPLPESVNNAIEGRLSHASETLRHIGQILALAGSATHRQLENLIASSSIAVTEALSEGVHRGLLTTDRPGTYAVRHDVIAEVMRSRLTDESQAELHAAIGRQLERDHGPQAAPRIAMHFHLGGLVNEALQFALEAADDAEAQGALPEAVRFLQIARQSNPSQEQEAVLLGRLADLRYLQTEMGLAASLSALAAAKHQALGLHDSSLRFLVQRFDALSEAGLLDHGRCLEELTALGDAAERNHLNCVLMASLEAKVRIMERLDLPAAVQQVLVKVRDLADRLSGVASAHAHMLLALEVFYGDPAVALASTSRAYALAAALDQPDLHLKAALRRFLVLIYQGTAGTSEGVALMRAVHEETMRTGDIRLKHTALVNEGVWHLEVRNLGRAAQLFAEAEAVIRGVRTPHDEVNRLGNLGATYLEMGQPDRAEEYFRQAQAFVDSGVRRVAVHFLHAGLGLCCARQGKVRQAREWATKIPSPPFWYYDPTYSVLLQSELHRLDQRPEQGIDLLHHASDQIRGRMVPQWLTLQEALVRLLRRTDPTRASQIAADAHCVCLARGLHHRAGSFVPVE